MDSNFTEQRSEKRILIDQYYSVEFSLKGLDYTYQFKIWNISTKGLCVVVKDDSAILEHLKVGEVLKMKYYQTDSSKPAEYMKTEIRHISRDESGKFKSHVLVGLLILEGRHPLLND